MRKAVILLAVTGFLCGGLILFQACAGGGDSGTSSSNNDQVTNAQTEAPVYAGYSTGTDVFVDVLKLLIPGAELVNLNAAFSAAAASSTAVLTTINSEMGHAVVPSNLVTAANAPNQPAR